jgi:hypothetical protein
MHQHGNYLPAAALPRPFFGLLYGPDVGFGGGGAVSNLEKRRMKHPRIPNPQMQYSF